MPAATDSVLTQLANHVLETTEKFTNHLADDVLGVSALFPNNNNNNKAAPSDKGVIDTIRDVGKDIMPKESMSQSPLEGIADNVLRDVLKGQSKPQNFFQSMQAFVSAIRWFEPFILSLVAFHVFMFWLCYKVTRPGQSLIARLVVMFIVGGLVRSSELLNQYGNEHWKSFATQNYFDRNGVFAAIFFSGPLLVDSFMMLAAFLLEASKLLVEVKRHGLPSSKKQSKTTNAEETKEPQRIKTQKEE